MRIADTFYQYKIQIFLTFIFFLITLYVFDNIYYSFLVAVFTGGLFFVFEYLTEEKEQQEKKAIKDYETIKFSSLTEKDIFKLQ